MYVPQAEPSGPSQGTLIATPGYVLLTSAAAVSIVYLLCSCVLIALSSVRSYWFEYGNPVYNVEDQMPFMLVNQEMYFHYYEDIFFRKGRSKLLRFPSVAVYSDQLAFVPFGLTARF
jgi:hypothetical protein